MNTLINRKFTTSQFAKMHDVNKKTLMYYDNIGLFCPAEVKSNGYRYYTFQQSFSFAAILLLRKMHVPLKDIKKYLENYNQNMLLDLLKTQEQTIDEQIQELLWLKKITQNKIASIENKKFIDFNKIEVVKENARPILAGQNMEGMSLEKTIPFISEFIRYCYQERLYCGYSSGVIMDAHKLRQEKNRSFKKFFYSVDLQETDKKELEYIPAGYYLTAYYKGSTDELDDFYEKIFAYADENNLQFAQHAYEEKLLDDMAAKDFEYVELKLSILLKKEEL